MRKAVRPIRQVPCRCAGDVADQRDIIAEPLLDDTVGQFNRGVEIFGIAELRRSSRNSGPLLERRKIAPVKSST